jgi:anti-repressor protein
MQELIKVATNADGKQVVSARDLHKFLEATERFSTWMERNLQYGFEENVDYIGCKQINTLANQELDDFGLTLNCAKEIAMIQRSDKGKQARQYFIECEKQLMQITIPKTLSEALYLAAKQAQTIEEQDIKLKLQEPKVEFAEQLLSATNSLDFGTSCKAMNLPFGRNRMFEICRKLNFIMHNNQPYQTYIDQGYFTLLETSYVNAKSGDRVLTTKTMITAKGQNWLIKNFKKNGLM